MQVQCFPLQSVMAALNYPTVDYFSLDIEGAEFPMLKTLDFGKVNILTFGIETNHAGETFKGSRKEIHEYLKENDYDFVGSVQIDDFFVKQK